MGVLRQRATITGKKGGVRLTATIQTLENGKCLNWLNQYSVDELDNDSQNQVQKNSFGSKREEMDRFATATDSNSGMVACRLPVSYEKKI